MGSELILFVHAVCDKLASRSREKNEKIPDFDPAGSFPDFRPIRAVEIQRGYGDKSGVSHKGGWPS